MKIEDFELLMDSCRITMGEDKKLNFTPFLPEDKAKIEQLVAENNLTSLPVFQQVVQAKKPLYQARKNIKQQAVQKFSEMSPSEVSVLPQEEKLKYMDVLFPHVMTKDDFIETCSKNEQNIKACLFNMDFPKEFWKEEQKNADRFASLVARTPEITDRIKNWPNTTLDEKKEVIFKANEIFKYVYGDAPEVKFFTPEQERARLVQQGLSEDVHIEAAYAQGKTINFNEERLQTSDNFFAVSVMFHEGTHFRQHTENFDDPLVDRIFKSALNRLNKYDNIINKKDDLSYKDFYAMLPSEKHAHSIQEYMEGQLTEKTSIEKTYQTPESKDVAKIHNKAFSMGKITQFHSR